MLKTKKGNVFSVIIIFIVLSCSGLEKQQAYKILRMASQKLPIKTKIVSRETLN